MNLYNKILIEALARNLTLDKTCELAGVSPRTFHTFTRDKYLPRWTAVNLETLFNLDELELYQYELGGDDLENYYL